MDLVVKTIQINSDNEEDDYGSYFLQPASSPYNIAEKVQQANIDLFNHTITMEKTSRVTFKEELASYEPELTDDDVNSIESEQEDAPQDTSPQILEYKSNVINLNMFHIDEVEEEDFDGEDYENVDEDVEDEEPIVESPEDSPKSSRSTGQDIATKEDLRPSSSKLDSSSAQKSNTDHRSRKKSIRFARSKVDVIDCRNHCIERLDFDLSMSIRRLEIHEKPPSNCPLLKLQTRQCCDEQKSKNPQNLPIYNGLNSEYGLSSAALERREKRKEIIKLKEEKRQQLLEEYKNRKNEQNEQVFCQWLKDVAQRKRTRQRQKIDSDGGGSGNSMKIGKQPLSPNVINFPTKVGSEKMVKERPKTANEFVPRHHVKRAIRPHTSPSCVFIQVPRKLLDKGIQLGDLLVTNAKIPTKKMHIMTVSS